MNVEETLARYKSWVAEHPQVFHIWMYSHFNTFTFFSFCTLSISHFCSYTFAFKLSLSPLNFYFHTFTFTLSLSHFNFHTFTLSHFHFHTFIFTLSLSLSGGNGRADLSVAIFFRRIWRSSRSLSRLLFHDHLGFSTFSRWLDCQCREIKLFKMVWGS